MGMPSLILKLATDFLTLVIKGFWPLIKAKSSTAFSRILLSVRTSPTTIVIVNFVNFCTQISLVEPITC